MFLFIKKSLLENIFNSIEKFAVVIIIKHL
jgi:hypothetical protein